MELALLVIQRKQSDRRNLRWLPSFCPAVLISRKQGEWQITAARAQSAKLESHGRTVGLRSWDASHSFSMTVGAPCHSEGAKRSKESPRSYCHTERSEVSHGVIVIPSPFMGRKNLNFSTLEKGNNYDKKA